MGPNLFSRFLEEASMDLWYSCPESPGADYRIRIKRPLFSAESQERRIDIFDTDDYGRILVLDGRIAVSELEGESYREMAVHVPLSVNPRTAAALVIGGGDGAVVSELVRHGGLERITVVEADSGVIEASRRWFPTLAGSFADPRVKVAAIDPSSFVRDTKERFDLIVVDDPRGGASGEGTTAQPFYSDCFRILSGDGILVSRAGGAGSPKGRRELTTRAGKLKRLFPVYRVYRAALPAGEPGEMLLGFASKRYDPTKDFEAANWEKAGIETRFYSPSMHLAAFALPPAIEAVIAGA